MRIPDGRDCSYYVINYHRRVTPQETCHLLEEQQVGENSSAAARWHSGLCKTCPVPDIRRANGCQSMVLQAKIGRRRWQLWGPPQILIQAICLKTNAPVKNPYVGCGQCHSPITFIVAEEPTKEDQS